MKRAARKRLVDLRDREAVHRRYPLLIAHRGGVVAPSAPENSLAAIRLAGTHGYDMVELDVARPGDDEPVLFHDRDGSLLTNCGIDAPLIGRTARELTALRYRASDEPIATLAQALALCGQLRLGVMLDIKVPVGAPPLPGFIDRIRTLLAEYALAAATLTIATDPPVRAALGEEIMYPVAAADFRRVCRGDTASLDGQFWFGLPGELPDAAVPALRRAGVLVLPAINTHRYPAHARDVLGGADIERLRAAGVDGFQIDSVYGDFFEQA